MPDDPWDDPLASGREPPMFLILILPRAKRGAAEDLLARPGSRSEETLKTIGHELDERDEQQRTALTVPSRHFRCCSSSSSNSMSNRWESSSNQVRFHSAQCRTRPATAGPDGTKKRRDEIVAAFLIL